MEPGYADGWVNVGARADPGRQHERRGRRCCRRRWRSIPTLAKTHFFLGTRAEEPRRLRRGARRTCDAPRRSIRAIASSQPARPRAVPEARVHRRRSRSFEQGAGHRSRGSAGPLQPDALLPGPRRRREGGAGAGALRRFKADESSQAITGPYRQLHPDDNNERQQIHEHRNAAAAQPVPPRLRARREPEAATDDEAAHVCEAGRGLPGRCSAWLRVVPRRIATCWSGPTEAPADPVPVHRRHRGGRHPTSGTTAAPSARSTCRRRSAPASRSSTSTATAGRTSSSSTRRTGPATRVAPSYPGALSQQPQRHVHRRHAAGRPRRRDVRHGRRRRRLRQRRQRRRLRHRARAEPPVPESAAASSPTSPPGPASATRASRPARRGSTTTSDGKLDLFVAQLRAVDDREGPAAARSTARHKSYCTPESYKGQSPTLYHNRGDGTFEDVTRKAGLYDPTSKALGVALLDYDSDGWLDLFVANDTQPNRLYRNKRRRHVRRRRA